MAMTEWQLEGFTGDDGELGRNVPPGYLMVPAKIDLEGDELVWEMCPDGNSPPKSSLPNRRMLHQFVNLSTAKAKATDILAFARRFGPLSFDSDEVPGSLDVSGREHIQMWKFYAGMARAILDIAAAVNKGKPGKPDDWKLITPVWFPDHQHSDFPPTKVGSARFLLQIRLRDWNCRRPTFALEWQHGRWGTRLDYGGTMFSALSLQLLLAVGTFEGVAVCSGAGCENQIYGRKRAAKFGQANFCPECKEKGEDKHQADVRRKAKMAAARRLIREGVPVTAIAAQLKTNADSVRRWVKTNTRR